jgi:hypothetical protein
LKLSTSYTYPKRIIFSTEPYRGEWLQSLPELKNDIQAHDEIIRQFFDKIDTGFKSFSEYLYCLPKWSYLVNQDYSSHFDTKVRYFHQDME